MKQFYLIIIFFFINSTKIFAQDAFTTGDSGLFNKKLEERRLLYGNPKMEFILEERDTDGEDDCFNCPNHLKIVSAVNKVLDHIAHDPKNSDVELPVDVKKLKFLFRDIKTKTLDGKVQCTRIDSPQIILDHDLKLDGQVQLIGEQLGRFSDIGSIMLSSPNEEAINYYYRSDGPEKNIIVQAIIEKNGVQRLRYFKYIPSELEKNPYNLPDLEDNSSSSTSGTEAIMPTYNEKEVLGNSVDGNDTNYKLKVGSTLEKRYNLPNNIHFVDGSYKNDITDGVKIEGDTHLTLLGNKANLNLSDGRNNYLTVNLETKLNGVTSKIITIPFSLNIPADIIADKKLTGSVRQDDQFAVLSMRLTDHNMEMFRTEIKSDNNTGLTTVLVARDIPVNKKEVYSMAAGTDANSVSFISIKQTKKLLENATAVIELRSDSNNKTKLYYTLNTLF